MVIVKKESTMTSAECDEVYRLKEELWHEVHALVNKKLEKVSPTIDCEVRQQLTEDFRFWK